MVVVSAYGGLLLLAGPGKADRIGGGGQRFIDAVIADGERVVGTTAAGEVATWVPGQAVQIQGAVPKERRALGGRVAPGGRAAVLLTDQGLLWWWQDAKPRLTRMPGASEVLALEWSANADRVFTVMSDGSIRIFSAASGELMESSPPMGVKRVHAAGPVLVTTAEDGLWLKGAGARRTDGTDAARKDSLRLGDEVSVLRLAGSGRRLAFARGRRIVLQDLPDGRSVARGSGHRVPIRKIRWAPGGTRVATAADDGVRIWSPKTGAEVGRLELAALDARWLNDRELLTLATDGTVARWSVANKRRTWRRQIEGAAAMDVAGGTVVVASQSSLSVLVAGTKKQQSFSWPQRLVAGLVASPDARRVAVRLEAPNGGAPLEIRDLATGETLHRVDGTKPRDRIVAAAFTPAGEALLIGRADGRLELLDPKSGVLTRLGRQRGTIADLAFASTGRWLAVATAEGTIDLWDSARKPVRSRSTLRGHHGAVRGIEWRGDGRAIASAGDDQDGLIWSAPGP